MPMKAALIECHPDVRVRDCVLMLHRHAVALAVRRRTPRPNRRTARRRRQRAPDVGDRRRVRDRRESTLSSKTSELRSRLSRDDVRRRQSHPGRRRPRERRAHVADRAVTLEGVRGRDRRVGDRRCDAPGSGSSVEEVAHREPIKSVGLIGTTNEASGWRAIVFFCVPPLVGEVPKLRFHLP